MTDQPPTEIPADPIVFYGRPTVFFLAICTDCGDPHSRPQPVPFATEADRDRWAEGHRSTGHHVDEAIEVRP